MTRYEAIGNLERALDILSTLRTATVAIRHGDEVTTAARNRLDEALDLMTDLRIELRKAQERA